MASSGGYSINSAQDEESDENTPLLTGNGQPAGPKAGTAHLVEPDHV